MTSVSVVNNQKDNRARNFAVGAGAAVIAYEAEPHIRNAVLHPVRGKIASEIRSIQGGGFKPFVEKAIKQNGLENKLNIIDLNANNAEAVKKQLGIANVKFDAKTKILRHIMRQSKSVDGSFIRTLQGHNAFFSPQQNTVVCNFDKFGAPVFHEIGHMMNSQSKNVIVQFLRNTRRPLSVYGTVAVSAVAMLTNSKEKREKPKDIFDKAMNFVKDNCGLVATAMMLPLTVEEIIASVKGGKIAKKAGLKGDLLKKVQKAHKISMASYIATAIATGIGAQLASKLRDLICVGYKKEAV